MNKVFSNFIFTMICCFTVSTPAQAWIWDDWNCPDIRDWNWDVRTWNWDVRTWDWNWDWQSGWSATARVAYFHPESSRLRKTYTNCFADYQLEVGKIVASNLQVWAGVCGFSKEGHSRPFHDSTRLQLIPLNLGVKYFFNLAPCIAGYVGGGVCYSMLSIKDHSHYVHKHTNKNEFGGLLQSGLNYYFNDCIFVNIFADYYFQEFHFKKHSYASHSRYVERNSINLSGYKLGAGVGYNF